MSQHNPVIATKKPTTVEAWRWDGTPEVAEAIIRWIGESTTGIGLTRVDAELHPEENWIVIGDGYEAVKPGQWVIRDKFNEFWPLPHDVYLAVYDSPIR